MNYIKSLLHTLICIFNGNGEAISNRNAGSTRYNRNIDFPISLSDKNTT